MPLNDKVENRKVIIVGAGIGGITTSIFLAKQGFKVKVFEKNPYPAGRCGQLVRDGHRFDLGATLLLMPSIYRQVFESLGLKFEEFISLKPLSTIYKLYFGNDGVLDYTSDRERMKAQLEIIEPGSSKNFELFVDKAYRFYQVSQKRLIGINFYSISDFFTLKNLLLFLWLKIHIRHYAFLKRYFKHPHLRQAFSFQNIYLGQSPYKAPALFSMIPAAECTEGALFPIGGMYNIPDRLFELAKELGVEFFFGTPVEKVNIENKQAQGITLADGTSHSADLVVINADLPYAYRKLLPDKRKSARIDRKNYACSAMVIHWGLKKAYPQLSHHSVFLSDDFRKSIFKIFHDKSLSDDPSFYLHAPARTDPTAAPPGEESISIVIPAGHLDKRYDQDWNRLLKTARVSIIDRLVKIGLTDIEDNIKFEICHTPADWEKNYNISRGSVFGSLSHTLFQMGYFRPHNRHDRYRNLYFVGGSTHPGNGVPLAMLSAKLTSERILKEYHSTT
jgi:phytoene desaturase